MEIMYATREQVSRSLEVMNSAYAGTLIDDAIKAASRSAEALLHRRFYPESRTITLDWPNPNNGVTWEIGLGDQELISASAVTSGGNTITSGILLQRGDDLNEPPYSTIAVDLSSSVSFSAGSTYQGAVSITGLFGYSDTSTAIAGGSLNANINSSVASIVINPFSELLSVGTGSLLLIGTERMVVIARSMALSGGTISSALLDTQASTLVATSDGTLFAAGEVILIGSERMYVNEIAGNNLIVTRAYDGTALAEHSSGTVIYAIRNATVLRGALGSTATSHTAADSVYVHAYPALLVELVTGEAIVMLEQRSAGYSFVTGTGGNTRTNSASGIDDLRERAYRQLGRMQRSTAV